MPAVESRLVTDGVVGLARSQVTYLGYWREGVTSGAETSAMDVQSALP